MLEHDWDAGLHATKEDLAAGYAVAWTPDVTGDGNLDLLIGAPNDQVDQPEFATGRVYVASTPFEGEQVLPEVEAVITTDEDWDGLGHDLAPVGDLDGDGIADVVLGSPGSEQAEAGASDRAGRALLFQAPVSGNVSFASADATIYHTTVNANLGAYLTGLEPTDAAEWAVVSSAPDGLARVHVLRGVPEALVHVDSAASATIVAAAESDGYGFPLSSADIDADGVADLLAGADTNNGNGEWSGAAFVSLGPFHGEHDAADGWIWWGEAALDRAGAGTLALGDVNEDGYGDFATTAFGHSSVASSAGRAYVVLGEADPAGEHSLADAHERIDGEQAYDELGIRASAAGDVDGDGAPDLAVLALGRWTTAPARTYLFFAPFEGGTVSASVAGRVITAEDPDNDSIRISGGADQNGDGFADLAIGSFGADPAGVTNGGQVFIVNGFPR